ncbi:hypothetical protein K466DRAFT_656765 [Polyporus arcularius HHB13444]|uniref:Uncharacterized protein n=1 Tax=Polyporus arcularius HHB13444 TaxID=1314778 RepID=A0A5C3NTH2_9APHY|nr:hypothetical protein K466DRAFT_656765 [Polyporus arcularius HHB13444]
MPVAGVLAALARCPGLVRLELSSAITSFPIQPREADRAVALPALEFFQIEDSSSGVSAFMPHIVFPPSTRVHIGGTDMDGLNPALMYVVSADIDRVAITVGHGPALMQCRSGREERLRVKSHPTSAGIQGLADALRSKASITELEWIRTQEYAGETLYLPLILCTLQNITSLTVSGFDADGVLDVLKTSDDSPPVCPHLGRLILGFLSSYTLSWYFLDAEGLPQEAVPEASTSVSSRCARIQPMLEARASRIGSRLTYLELYEFSKPQRGFTSLRLVTIEKTSPFWTSVEPSLQALRSLVDGPVMFGGFKTEINPPDP